MPCKQAPCQAGKLQNEGRNIGQNNETPTKQNQFSNKRIRGNYQYKLNSDKITVAATR